MDMNWLSNEAKQIHDLFSALFYSVVVLMIALGVVLSFLKMSMGQVPEFLSLVGRAVLAAFILAGLPGDYERARRHHGSYFQRCGPAQ